MIDEKPQTATSAGKRKAAEQPQLKQGDKKKKEDNDDDDDEEEDDDEAVEETKHNTEDAVMTTSKDAAKDNQDVDLRAETAAASESDDEEEEEDNDDENQSDDDEGDDDDSEGQLPTTVPLHQYECSKPIEQLTFNFDSHLIMDNIDFEMPPLKFESHTCEADDAESAALMEESPRTIPFLPLEDTSFIDVDHFLKSPLPFPDLEFTTSREEPFFRL